MVPFIKKISSGRIARLAFILVLTACTSPLSRCQQVTPVQPFGEGIQAKRFYSSTVDDDNNVWFLTEYGIVSFDGTKWTLHNNNPKVPSSGLKSLIYDNSSKGWELLIATTKGATIASLPLIPGSGVSSFSPENSKILSENVLALTTGKKEISWFGTDKGISAFKSGKWLPNDYEEIYPEDLFKDLPITSMATTIDGDSLYVGTIGGGIFRVYRNDVDAVSGASEYAQWGPIQMPSDSVYSVHVTPDGTQWFGTSKGVAKHEGYKTLEGWTVYQTVQGLADDLVNAINSDNKGNLYFGTKNGLSIFDGKNWTTIRIDKGLVSNNILSIAIDKNNVVWLGTDSGVTCIKNGKLINYK
jgi:ligand-binding sensor domain-containing protein